MIDAPPKLETNPNRIFGLDLVRAFAIIIVVHAHGNYMLNNTTLENFPYLSMIGGVEIFFVLSGFLIGGILLKELSSKTNFRIPDLLNFWKRRWFRTLPNYYLILLINILFVKYGIINEDFEQFNFHFFTFTQNFSSPFYGFFWESWSLSVEEWFYLLTPILILILYKLTTAKTSFLLTTIFMIVFSMVYRYNIYDPNVDGFWWDVTFRKVVLCRLDSIGYGLLSAWFYFYYPSYWKQTKHHAFALGFFLLLFVLNYEKSVTSMYQQTLYFSLVPFTVMLFFPMAENLRQAHGLLALGVEHISKISYSMYLINLALVSEVIRDNFAPKGGLDGLTKYFIYWVVVLVVSSLLYKYFEKPIMKLRDRI